MKKREGSYTVELALLLPMLLISLFVPIHMGYEMYMQTKEASVCIWEEQERAEEQVLKIKFAKDVLEEWK